MGYAQMSLETSRKGWRRIRSCLIPLCIFLIAAEAGLRIVFPVPEVLNFNRINYSVLHLTPEMQNARHLSNGSFTWASAPDSAEFVHVLNLYGFRDSDWDIEKQDGRPRIMFVGDSFVEGMMAPQGNTIPDYFEQAARRAGHDVDALNMGVSASSVTQYLPLIRDAVPIFRPDQVILVLYANDLPVRAVKESLSGEPLKPAFSNPWQPRILYVIDRIRQNQTVARRWTTRPFTFLSPVPHENNFWSVEEKAKKFESFVDPDIAASVKQGRFNPALIDQNVRFEERLRAGAKVNSFIEQTKAYSVRRNVPFLVAYIPHRDQVSDAYLDFQRRFSSNRNPTSLKGSSYQVHAQALAAACASLDVPFLDLTTVVRAAEERGERLYWRYDSHMNEQGYALLGETLYKWWQRLHPPE